MGFIKLLILLISFTGIHSLPAVAKKPSGRNMVSPVQIDAAKVAEETETAKSIEKFVASVPMINFEGDVVVLQFLNRLNKKTDYRHVSPELINKVIYERNSLDLDKEVVVLRGSEDHIESKGQKRVYVVLRRNNVMGDRRLYYVSYLYIKDAAPGQEGVHVFGNHKVTIEWDFWDNRESFESKGQLESAFSCPTTIFMPCRSNETIDFPLPSVPRKPGAAPSSRSGAVEESPPSKIKHATHSNKSFIVPGGEPDKYIDFFNDLDKIRPEGRGVKFNFQSMATFGKGKRKITGKDASNYQGQVFNFMDTDMKAFHTMIQTVIEAGMGLVKSFNGLFGGLGTPEAKVDEVVKSTVDIEDADDFVESLSKSELEELEDEIKLPSSGGLGGLINADESREAEEEGISLRPPEENETEGEMQGRSMKHFKSKAGTSLGGSNPENIPESPFIKYGWNTESEPGSEDDPFVGFGACRYRKVTLQDFKRNPTPAELIRLYQTILRTQCITKDTLLFQKILEDDILLLDEDKISFTVNAKSPILKQEKLQQKQRIRMYRAMELFFFSKVYLDELTHPRGDTVTPDNAPISRSVFTLGRMIVKGLTSRNVIPKQHCIKLGRNLVKTLRLALSKLTEDMETISPQDKEINFNDRVFLVGLMQYIIHAYDALLMTESVDIQKTFENFYVQNRELLEDKINSY